MFHFSNNGETYSFTHAVTHGGKFHADDVMSAALLQLRFATYSGETVPRVVRYYPGVVTEKTYVPESIANQIMNFVTDCAKLTQYTAMVPIVRYNGPHESAAVYAGKTGLLFDIGYGEFDHHQENPEVRDNGVMYAALGKLWRAIGKDFFPDAQICEFFDEHYIQPIDRHDTTGEYYEIADVIESMNGVGEELNDGALQNERFVEAMKFATQYLENRLHATWRFYKEILRIRELDQLAFEDAQGHTYAAIICNWRVEPRHVEMARPDCDVVVYPHERGGYAVRGLETARGQWLNDEKLLHKEYALAAGCRFCHNGRFIACFNHLEEAILSIKNTDRRIDPYKK